MYVGVLAGAMMILQCRFLVIVIGCDMRYDVVCSVSRRGFHCWVIHTISSNPYNILQPYLANR